MHNSNNKLKAARKAAFKDTTLSGNTGSAPVSSGPSRVELFGTRKNPAEQAKPGVSSSIDITQYEQLGDLISFIEKSIDDCLTYSRSDPSVADTKRILDSWVSALIAFKPHNVSQTQALNTAIRALQGRYKNKRDALLKLEMFGNTNWWNEVANIFSTLSKFLKRTFIRPKVAQQPRAGHLNTPDTEYYEQDAEGNPIYSKEEIVIIGDIRDLALKAILVAKNSQSKIDNLASLVSLYKSAATSLIREETTLVGKVAAHFKSVKFNFGGLFNKLRDKVDAPYDDVLVKRLNQEIHKAELDAQFPQKIKPTMVVYGSKIADYNSKKKNQGFRDRETGEGNDVYALRQKIFAIYGDAYYAYLLRITQEPKNELSLMDRESTPFVTVSPEVSKEAFADAITQKSKLEKFLTNKIYIEPDYVVYGTRVSNLNFRKFDPKIDYNKNIYVGRAEVWKVWSVAYRKQYAEIMTYVDKLKEAENTPVDKLPDDYDGVPINFKQFRDFDKTKDSNKQVYLIKVRIWNTYHNLSISYESDVVNNDFQNLYQKTIEFVDSLIDAIEDVTNDQKTYGVFGGQTPARMAMQKLINDIDLFNKEFTTVPWNKTFILLQMGGEKDKGNDYTAQLAHIISDLGDLSKELTAVSNALNQENVALKVLTRSIDKYNPDGTNAFLEYYKKANVELPGTNSPNAIANYLFQFLLSSKSTDDEYGIGNILELV